MAPAQRLRTDGSAPIAGAPVLRRSARWRRFDTRVAVVLPSADGEPLVHQAYGAVDRWHTPVVLTPILATLVYVLSPDRSQVLMLHRNKRDSDIHYGKYNGLGGKVERDEDVASGAIREVFEESGLVVTAMSLRGTISWPGFGPGGQDWFAFVFLVDGFTGTAHAGNDEGTLSWQRRESLATLPMWDSDHQWLPLVFDGDPRPFHGVMPWRDGQWLSWDYRR